jgi:hypothetical protein
MGRDHLLLASLQGPIEVFDDHDILRDDGAESFSELRR